MTTPEFTILENGLRKPFLEMVKKYGKQKYTLWTIWTYMKWRSENDNFSLPEKLVREDLGIDLNVLRDGRSILTKEGWLQKGVMRDTGGEYLTRTWVVTAPPSVYHSLGMEPPGVFTTEGKSPYSGSSSCSGSGSSSLSTTSSYTLLDSNKGSAPKSVRESKEKIEAKSKPTNLEPNPKPTPAPVRVKVHGHGKDGTPYPAGFDDWSNLDRLHWLGTHGWKQGGMDESASQKTLGPVDRDGKPTPTAKPLPTRGVPRNLSIHEGESLLANIQHREDTEANKAFGVRDSGDSLGTLDTGRAFGEGLRPSISFGREGEVHLRSGGLSTERYADGNHRDQEQQRHKAGKDKAGPQVSGLRASGDSVLGYQQVSDSDRNPQRSVKTPSSPGFCGVCGDDLFDYDEFPSEMCSSCMFKETERKRMRPHSIKTTADLTEGNGGNYDSGCSDL